MSENKHQNYELKQMQCLPLNAKIRMTNARIEGWCNEFEDMVYVSRSGGKDSDVLGDLVKKICPDAPQIFINTGLEFDSVRRHGIEVADEVLYPEMNFVEVIKKYGYPVISKEVAQKVYEARNNPNGESMKRFGDCEHNRKYPQFSMEKYAWLLEAPFKIGRDCCTVMKKKPAKSYEKKTGRKIFVGTMAEESRLRKTEWLKNGCNSFDAKRPRSAPLSFWTEQDILEYIYRYKIKIADVYGDVVMKGQSSLFGNRYVYDTTGVNRTGCVFCLFGISQDKDRLLKLRAIEPKKYEFVMNGGHFEDEWFVPDKNGLGYKFVIDWLNEHGHLGIKY